MQYPHPMAQKSVIGRAVFMVPLWLLALALGVAVFGSMLVTMYTDSPRRGERAWCTGKLVALRGDLSSRILLALQNATSQQQKAAVNVGSIDAWVQPWQRDFSTAQHVCQTLDKSQGDFAAAFAQLGELKVRYLQTFEQLESIETNVASPLDEVIKRLAAH
jgi:hypothetical protein